MSPWPFDDEADAALDEKESSALQLSSAIKGLEKARKKSANAALRVDSNQSDALQERLDHWNARIVKMEKLVSVASESLDEARAKLARLPSRVKTITRKAHDIAEAHIVSIGEDNFIVETRTVSTSAVARAPSSSAADIRLYTVHPTLLKGCHWEFEIACFDKSTRHGIFVAATAWD